VTPTPAPTLPPAVSAVRDLPIGWVAFFLIVGLAILFMLLRRSDVD